MNKNPFYSIFLVIALLGVLGVVFNIRKVEAPYQIIYIMADGSISPSEANITSSDKVTYTFTANINASIIVQRSNITIDGNGQILNGSFYPILHGFNLTNVSNVTIKNVNIMGFGYGVYLQSSTWNIISGNNITFNEGNIYLGDSSDNTIASNTITDGAEAIQLYASSSNAISGNSMRSNYKGVWLRSNSAGNVISGNNIAGNYGRGIDLSASSNNTLSGNNVTGNSVGISVGSALVDSVIVRSMNNTILGNNIVKNNNGIDIVGVLYTTISRNLISENSQYGIILDAASNNTISANNITNNNLGIFYDGLCNNNTAYHNNFIDNIKQVEVSPGDVDTWDDGVEGNYWSDYSGNDTNNDGIGEVPYEIDLNNNDMRPLMGMFYSFNTSIAKYVNAICNSTVDSFEYVDSTINLLISNSSEDQTFGFVRICIPHALMNETYHVTVNGTDPYYVNYNLADNSTHRWIYFEYEHSTLEIVIIPEFPSFLILPLFMIATLLAVIVYRRKHSM